MTKDKILPSPTRCKVMPSTSAVGFDPELLFVECSKCGNPIIWEKGRSTEILLGAGIDPMELDPHCFLVTDGCPNCTKEKMYRVQIYCVSKSGHSSLNMRSIGHA